ncbi:hypothetical protein GCM10010915_01530 [Microbacterium faecale]|uniref:Uncharacterized protein n=1 Tax=Microbacterium faecale TaxID=1804630 RepID=A0A916Y045_9MICO|nr:hypothetical protein [Microbacterium faecale]GGD25323.1 hypothetical protein GCM10010915_01530 [Microbacterium faecale]
MFSAILVSLLGVVVLLFAIGIVVLVVVLRGRASRRDGVTYARPDAATPVDPPRAESDPRDGQTPPGAH